MKLVSVYEVLEAPAILYKLLAERSTEDDEFVNISHRQLPTPAEHMEFFISEPYHHWYLIQEEGNWVGYISTTWRNEIGIVLFRDCRGMGYGERAVSLFMEQNKPEEAIPSKRVGTWLANINPRNERSIRMFERLGFKKVQVTYAKD